MRVFENGNKKPAASERQVIFSWSISRHVFERRRRRCFHWSSVRLCGLISRLLRSRSGRCSCRKRSNPPYAQVVVPFAAVFSSTDIEGNLDAVPDLVLRKFLDLVGPESREAYRGGIVPIHIFDDKILAFPGSAGGLARADPEFGNYLTFNLKCHYFCSSSATATLPTLLRVMSKCSTELGAIPRLPRSP